MMLSKRQAPERQVAAVSVLEPSTCAGFAVTVTMMLAPPSLASPSSSVVRS